MRNLHTEKIATSRRRLGNPYAHIEDLVELDSGGAQEEPAAASAEQVGKARKLAQDPYAYLDGDGGFAGTLASIEGGSKTPKASVRTRDTASSAKHSDREIAEHVSRLHADIWVGRYSLWPDGPPPNPVEMLDPAVALHLLDYECQYLEVLGSFHDGNGTIEVAGDIDQERKRVRISMQLPQSAQMFTLAHELGHAVLHPGLAGLHRDRPADGTERSREGIEIEADKFAALFLMPEKLVRERFRRSFGATRFVLDDDTAFALVGQGLPEARLRFRTRRALSSFLASADRFDGNQLIPLADQFRVSFGAMAIRLEELNLLS